MKILIVEDDFTSRILMQELLGGYGPTHVAVNGREALAAVKAAMDSGEPYRLICLDVMMPEMDGHSALREIRALEESRRILSTHGAKVIMTTALADSKNVMNAYGNLCDAYLVKPIQKKALLATVEKLGLTA